MTNHRVGHICKKCKDYIEAHKDDCYEFQHN